MTILAETFLPLIIAFLAAAVLGALLVPVLKKKHIGNTEREELKSHQSKNGTPSMGGIVIIAGAIAGSAVCIQGHAHIIPVLLVMLAFGAIGFIDDYLKAIKHKSDGFSAKQKFALEAVVAVIFLIYLIVSGTSLDMIVPFGFGRMLALGWFAVPVMLLAVLGTVNAVNFTDGLDGLASCVTIAVAFFFAVASILLGSEMTPVCCAVIGALFGFLIYNIHPAKVFMGDTGSLALGGFVAAAAYMMQLPVFILIAGLIYWAELISVMLQVAYFKKTGGKRIFRMAPLHHHYELGGWPEVKVVCVFTAFTAVMCAVSVLGVVLWTM